MKKEVFFGFVLLLLLAGMPILSPQAKVSNDVNASLKNNSEVRVSVKIENQSSSGFLTESSSTSNIKKEIKKKFDDEKHDFGDVITLDISKSDLKELKKTSGIEEINKVEKKELFLSESKEVINTSDANNVNDFSGTNLTGKGESVCILDTGADTDHPDLKGQNATCVVDCTGSSCNENCSVQDYDGHGTHMAGIITGNGSVEGVSKGAKYIPVKVCTQGSGCFNDDIKAGLDWCRNNMDAYNISVASMSLGSNTLYDGYCDDVSDGDVSHSESINITGSIDKSTKDNLSVIVSSGNDASTSKTSNPACVKSAVPVGSTNDLDMSKYNYNFSGSCASSSDEKDEISCFSNRNNITNLMAPGSIINSTYRQNSYSSLEGTSMAAPHVAAAFAIINQYKELESSKTLEPQTIEESLNDSGKRITDSGGSGLTFSRIDIFGSLLDLDEKAPNITSVSPQNSSNYGIGSNANLSCNTSDELQLKNSTIKIWDSTSLRNKSLKNASSNSLENNLTAKDLEKGKYNWNCITYDEKGNKNKLSSNYTFTSGNISSNLKSPTDNKHTNKNSTNFSCFGETFVENSSLENSTFKLWNSSGLEYNETANISGTSNTTYYSYTFEKEGSYEWDCEFSNNRSDSTLASSNNSLTYDSTNPNVTLISPNDGKSKSEGSQTVNFDYNVSEKNLDKCSLLVDNSTKKTNSSVNTSITNTFSKSLSSGSYSWKISCTDLAGNSINSSSRSLTIESSSNNNGGSVGGGGGSGGSNNNEEENNETGDNQTEQNETEGKTENISQSEIDKGVSKSLGKGDKVEFDIDSTRHSMEVKNLGGNYADITIRSDPINLSINVNDTEKVNLNNDEYLDLKVKLNSIEDDSANLSMKEIEEKIGSKSLHQGTGIQKKNNNENDNNEENSLEEPNKNKFLGSTVSYVLAGLLILFVAAIIVYFKFKRKPKEVLETLKSYND